MIDKQKLIEFCESEIEKTYQRPIWSEDEYYSRAGKNDALEKVIEFIKILDRNVDRPVIDHISGVGRMGAKEWLNSELNMNMECQRGV